MYNYFNVAETMIIMFDMVENVAGKGENADHFNLSFSHNLFKSLHLQGRKNLSLCGKALKGWGKTNFSKPNGSYPITRRQTFRLFQTETNCRRHFKKHLKWKISTI